MVFILAICLKPFCGPSVSSTLAIDKLLQYDFSALVATISLEDAVKFQKWILQHFVCLSKYLLDRLEARVDTIVIPWALFMPHAAGVKNARYIPHAQDAAIDVVVWIPHRLTVEPLCQSFERLNPDIELNDEVVLISSFCGRKNLFEICRALT